MTIKLSLIDNDYVVKAKTDLDQNGHDDPFRTFVKQVQEELVTGQTAYLEIKDAHNESVTFEITQAG